jgi:hypothetical protein
VQISWECTPPYLSTGISNLLQPAQAEAVLGQHSTYLASWEKTTIRLGIEGLHNTKTHAIVKSKQCPHVKLLGR